MNEAERALSQIERDRIETYLSYDEHRLPWWQSLGFAVAGGIALAAMEIESRWLAIIVALGAAALVGGLAGMAIRRAGAVPRLGTMPASLRRVLIGYWIVAFGGLTAILAWAFTTDTEPAFAWAGAIYFILVVVAGSVADALYRRNARRLADRTRAGHG